MHRMRHDCLIVGLLVGIVLGPRPSEAQYTNDYQTNTISGVTSNWSGDYVVGSNTFADVLLIQNTGVLSIGCGYLGYEVSSSNNSVQVTGTSLWNHSGELYNGYSGAGNSLVISNGGQVLNTNGFVGYNPSSSNNSVLVTGTGSVWSSNINLYVGYSGAGNSLVINNGGQVLNNQYGYVGYTSSSSNNSVLVTGTGSVWSNGSILWFGGNDNDYLPGGAGNSLVISNGGQVFCGGGFVGGNSSSSNNSVLVTGTGSVWNSDALSVGSSGAGNSLVISDGGQVVNGWGYVGCWSSGSSNSVLVTGAGSVWSNSAPLLFGYYGAGNNSLVISDGGRVVNYDGYMGFSSSNSVLVTGTGSVWNNRGELLAGGSSNRLVISNGGEVVSGAGDLVGASNSALVTGAGSVWNCGWLLTVDGQWQSDDVGSSLVISDGGKVVVSSSVTEVRSVVGDGTPNNSVLVTGSGSVLNCGDELWLGVQGGTGNRVVISDGGQLLNNDSGSSYIGYAPGVGSSSNNSVVVTGPDSFWNSQAALTVGYAQGTGNRLVISNGGIVANDVGFVGRSYAGFGSAEGSSNNWALVTGTSSVWCNQKLYVGYGGSSNLLTIVDAGWVFASDLFIGYTDTDYGGGPNNVGIASNNVVRVDGGSLVVANAAGNGCLVVGVVTNPVVVGLAGGKAKLILNSGTVTVDVLIATNGANSVVTYNAVAGTLATGTTLAHGAVLQFALGTNSHPWLVSSNLTLGGTLDITDAGGFTTNTYTLFTYGGALTYNGLTISATPTADFAYSIDTNTIGQVNLIVIPFCSLPAFQQWQMNYFGCTNCPQAAVDADPDGDGQNNLAEFLTGADPTNSASAFRITGVTQGGDDLCITWATAGGRTNAVQVTAGDANGSYTTNFVDLSEPIIIPGTGDATTNYVDIGGATNSPARYYRIRLVP